MNLINIKNIYNILIFIFRKKKLFKNIFYIYNNNNNNNNNSIYIYFCLIMIVKNKITFNICGSKIIQYMKNYQKNGI